MARPIEIILKDLLIDLHGLTPDKLQVHHQPDLQELLISLSLNRAIKLSLPESDDASDVTIAIQQLSFRLTPEDWHTILAQLPPELER